MNEKYSESQDTKIIASHKKAFLIIGSFMGIMFLATMGVIIGFSRININTGRIEITKAIITNMVDVDGNAFPSNGIFPSSQPRIYCYIAINSSKPIQVGVRWYYGDKKIFEDMEEIYTWKAYYIEPIAGEKFRTGDYHVEIYLIDKAIRTLSFSIK